MTFAIFFAWISFRQSWQGSHVVMSSALRRSPSELKKYNIVTITNVVCLQEELFLLEPRVGSTLFFFFLFYHWPREVSKGSST